MIRPTALELLEAPTPEAIRLEIERLGLAQTELAALLRIAPRTLRRYLQAPGTDGYVPMPFPTFALIKHLRAPIR